MLAGALLLAVVWVFLLLLRSLTVTPFLGPGLLLVPTRPTSWTFFCSEGWRSCAGGLLASASWEGGSGRSPAMLTPSGRASRRPHAWPRPDPLLPDPAPRPQRRVPRARRCLRRHAGAPRSARRRTTAIRSQRIPRAAHPAGGHADASRSPAADPSATTMSWSTPPRGEHPSDRPHRGAAPAQPRRPAVVRPRQVDLSLIAEQATETLLPFADDGAPPSRPPGRAPDGRLDRAPAADGHEPRHDAVVHNLPATAPCGSRRAFTPKSVELTVDRIWLRSSPRSWLPRSSSRFVVAPNAYAPTNGGVGLGLAIVKSIARHTTEP